MAQPQQVNITDLDLPSLQQVKVQLEEEVSHLTQSYSRLKGAQSRFIDCRESVDALKGEKPEDKTILVPLTSSLYVPGKLSNVEKVIVDIGTGYYVEKSVEDASKFYDNKTEFVKKNLEKLQESITSKQSTLRAIINVMQEKMQQQDPSATK
ncbi:prefoldin, alpha subunit [Radiomyces spectabilis]|uniref:prefoldin, alpha subunit n=1 Tax=Radiomyces spectabilis TaxID=64574 RepID=UPI0022209D3F|nr:prefoldin, alpha subunit [Radiomyces spectabilis]KAI8379684.1 prefoldin, alpha subunit [Radiomyces spectabilis]